MKLMLRDKDAMEKWFKENGWEETKTKFGRGWKKEGWKPWLDQFYFYSARIFDTDPEDKEDFEEREDDEGRKVYFFPGVKKHFYPEWMEGALMHKLDAALDSEDVNLGSDDDFWK